MGGSLKELCLQMQREGYCQLVGTASGAKLVWLKSLIG